jgi:hypothetical protein
LPTKKFFSLLTLQVVVVGLLAFAYMAWDADTLYKWLSGDVLYADQSDETCNLNQQTCKTTFGDGTPIAFSIDKHPVVAMKPLVFRVEAPTKTTDTLEVEIYGLSMNMGRYTYTLKHQGEGKYEGKGVIPACTSDMLWRINIIEEHPTKRIGAYYKLQME